MSDKSCLSSDNYKVNNEEHASKLRNPAYPNTELHGFDFNRCDNSQNWMELKAEIDNLLQTSRSGSELLQKSKQVTDYWNRVREYRKNR